MQKHNNLIDHIALLTQSVASDIAVNPHLLFNNVIKKHNLSPEDVESDAIHDWYFSASGFHLTLLQRLTQGLPCRRLLVSVPSATLKKIGISGNTWVKCTTAEFIQLHIEYHIYKALYKHQCANFNKDFISKILPPLNEYNL